MKCACTVRALCVHCACVVRALCVHCTCTVHAVYAVCVHSIAGAPKENTSEVRARIICDPNGATGDRERCTGRCPKQSCNLAPSKEVVVAVFLLDGRRNGLVVVAVVVL